MACAWLCCSLVAGFHSRLSQKNDGPVQTFKGMQKHSLLTASRFLFVFSEVPAFHWTRLEMRPSDVALIFEGVKKRERTPCST